jgi:hypothetical protein
MKTLARQRDRDEILQRLKRLRPESTARWGRMSAHQMICHLADSFRMAIGEKPVNPDTSLARRTIVKWLALYAPLRWPPGLLTVPEIDQSFGGTKPAAFAADVADVEAQVQRLGRAPQIVWQRHPYFGRMSSSAWLRWGYLHSDHHLRQFGV